MGLLAAFRNVANALLATLTTEGDILFRNATSVVRLARGTDNQVLTATATTINWEAGGAKVGTANTWSAIQTYTSNIDMQAFLVFTPTELTIATARVTATRSAHQIDTESDDPTDTMTHMDGNAIGRVVVLTSVVDTRDPTLSDEAGGAGSLNMAGNFTMATANETIVFIGRLGDGATFQELSRSTNG